MYDDQKFARTVAIDRTRKMKFKIVPKEKQEPGDNLAKEADEPTKTDESKEADEAQKAEEIEKMINLPEKPETRSKR